MKVAKQNIGNAGEYFIAYLLSANNCIVTVTLGRTEGFDLLIVNPKNKTLKISVKTTFYKTKSLMMTKKVEEIKGSDIFYAFVRFSTIKKLPDCWIVPSKVVAEIATISHQKYLESPKRNGTPRKDSSVRKFYLVNHKNYPPNWEKILDQYKNNIDPILN
ncbi:hypothetical protein LCGC14_1719860 [marine sediment metagenome]|uniref:Aspartate ammonia-lyase n=1 Tax=marine sediment metagenome TaxID=412755 RepID=A0A0F9I0H6_9ZZZZ|nr:hypothetical protein [bacterium]